MSTRRMSITVILLCLVPLTAVLSQRTGGSFSLSAYGSVGLSMTPETFKDFWKTGFGFGGELKCHITKTTGLAVSFTYQPFKLDGDAIIEWLEEQAGEPVGPGMEVEYLGGGTTIDFVSINIIQYFTTPPAPFGFYVTAGGGYYMPKMDDANMKFTYLGEPIEMQRWEEDDWGSDNGFGINGGVGLELMLGRGKVCLFVEGEYHHTFIDMDSEGLEETAGKKGGKISFITIMGGIRFRS